MKKLFIFLTMLVLGIVSSWADSTYTIIDDASGGVWTNGSYSSDNGSSTWKGSWTSTSTTPQITVSAHTWLLQNSTGYIGSSSTKTGNFTISINNGYLITGYEIKFENVNTDGSHNQTITPNGKSGVTAEGTGSATVAVTGLNTRAAYFKLTGENSLAKVTKFTVTYVSSSTWTSGVTGVGGNGNYYSDTWYLKLTTPNADDVFLDNFTLGIASDGTHDTELETYLAFSQGKFSEQNNHKASEFLAISSNSISGHSSATANIKEFVFDETVRLNGNTDVYVCFVSKNVDGTYNLRQRGLAVKNIGKASGLIICKGNNYTTSETSCGNYQCQYSCTYSISHDYPQTVPDDYYIWSGINDGDKTSGGNITVAYIKYTAPGTSDKVVQFNQFSLSLRNSDVVANTYLLLSKECLTGIGVTTSTTFAPSRFTAISSNSVPSANYGKVFTFTFDSDQFLHGGQTYYIYMGTKNGDNFNLQKYGLFINHQMDVSTGFQYSSALETAAATTNDAWQAIYYSSRCSFVDPSSLLEDAYTYVNYYSGNSLGKYTSDSYTPNQIATALSDAESVYSGSDGSAKFLSYLTLKDIKESLTNLNLPAGNTFLRIRGNSDKYVAANTATNVAQMSRSNDATTIFYLTSDKKLISYSNGLGLYWTHAFAAPENASSLNTFTFSEGGSTGKYTIQSNASTVHERTVDEYFSDGGGESLGRAASVSSPSTDWQLTEVTSLPVTFKAAGLGYATFHCPVPVKIPSGVSAYVSKINGTKIKLYQIHHDNLKDGEYYVIPANTPVLLHVDDGLDPAGDDYEASFVISDYDGEGISGDDFYGTIAAEAMGSGTYYSLRAWTASGDTYPSKVGFYTKSGDLAGFKAWIHDDSSSARNFTIVFDGDSDPTGIVEALGLENDNVDIFDLNGRKLSSYRKGINIVNGKKVMVQ